MTRTEPVPTGMAVLDMAREGHFAGVRDLLAPPLRPMVAAEALQAAWQPSSNGALSVQDATIGGPVEFNGGR